MAAESHWICSCCAFSSKGPMNPDDAALAQHFFSEAVLDFQRGNTTQAIANYMRALELAPDFPEAHSNLGVAWRQAGNLRAAELSYREALRIRPGYAEPYNNLGNLFAIDGRLDEANECFRKAIELRPDFVSAYVHL